MPKQPSSPSPRRINLQLSSLNWRLAVGFVTIGVASAVLWFWITPWFVTGAQTSAATPDSSTQAQARARSVISLMARSHALASAIATEYQNSTASLNTRRMQTLVSASGLERTLSSVGIWPRPNPSSKPPGQASRLWTLSDNGELQYRVEYQDPRAIAYWREAWYTPAPYVRDNRCYWTPVYKDALLKKPVVTCSLRMAKDQRFTGVVTVTLKPATFDTDPANAGSNAYTLLIDGMGRILGAPSAHRQWRNKTLAQVGQQHTGLQALAVKDHRQSLDFLKAASRSAHYDEAIITRLQQRTRDLGLNEATAALSSVWHRPRTSTTLGEPTPLAADPILHTAGRAWLNSLPNSHWKLWTIERAPSPAHKHRMVGGLIFLCLLGVSLVLAFVLCHKLLTLRLQRMLTRLQSARNLDEAILLRLQDTKKDEIGRLAAIYDQRADQLQEMQDQIEQLNARLVLESGARARAEAKAEAEAEQVTSNHGLPHQTTTPESNTPNAPSPSLKRHAAAASTDSDDAHRARQWVRQIDRALDNGQLHLSSQCIIGGSRQPQSGGIWEITAALEDEEGFWNHSADFMHVAEDSAAVSALDRWTLQNGLAHLAKHPELLPGLALCVLPAHEASLSDGSLIDQLLTDLDAHKHIPPTTIAFVLRRHSLQNKQVASISFARALHDAGCKLICALWPNVADDDIELLRKLKPDGLRMDSADFRSIEDPSAPVRQAAKRCLEQAQSLSNLVLIENVDTPELAQAWRELGADYLQGDAVSRSSPILFSRD